MRPPPEAVAPRGMIWGLQRRLLVLLLITVGLIVSVSVFFHYQSAGTAALQQDQRLLRLVPLLADSVVVRNLGADGSVDLDEPLQRAADLLNSPGLSMLLAPAVAEFLSERRGFAAFGVFNDLGSQMLGERWLPTVLPATRDAEFLSVVEAGVTYRVVAQRVTTDAGELIVMLADGSDARQQWFSNVLLRVLLPNLILFAVAAAVISWGVARALQPLIELKQAVENRSPRDLNPIDAAGVPAEVRPLVVSLNRLFFLVNAQTDGQRASWPMPRTSCARRWPACRRRWKPGRRPRAAWTEATCSACAPARCCACATPRGAPRNSPTSCSRSRAPMR